jgi:hypothetical protein
MEPDFVDFHFYSRGISLMGIFSGLVVAHAVMNARQLDRWTSVFLWTTVLTSVTGFMFPFHGFQASCVVGAISLVVLALAIFALYRQHLAGGWRTTYVISSMIALGELIGSHAGRFRGSPTERFKLTGDFRRGAQHATLRRTANRNVRRVVWPRRHEV